MVRCVPGRRQVEPYHGQAPDAHGPRADRGEAGGDPEGRDPPRGEGAGTWPSEARRGRPETVRARQTRDVRLILHQAPGLRIRRCLHARGHAEPRKAQDLRAHRQGQEPGTGDQISGRPHRGLEPPQREAPRVVRHALPRTGRPGQGRQVRATHRQARRQAGHHR